MIIHAELAPLTQLGGIAIWNGSLANKPRFFGLANAEVISRSADDGWNRDYTQTVGASAPWQLRGGASNELTSAPGVFSAGVSIASATLAPSHRAILSGY